MFRSALRYLKFKPADGLHVVARGRVSVYEPKGEYQLVCEHLEPQGLGALQLAFEQLKKRLQAEGLFDAARKRPLPALPRKIGIVTSLDGAALRDIIKVLRRRYRERAPRDPSGARAGRGRGARDRARRSARSRACRASTSSSSAAAAARSRICGRSTRRSSRARSRASPVPVISAVGHETDVTIADFVADLRAPTPSAAAELVVAAKDEFCGAHRSAARIGCAPRRAARVQRLEPARPRRSTARPAFAGVPGAARDARPPRRGADARARAHRCAPASPRASAAVSSCERQLDDASTSAAGSPASARAWSAPTAG